MNLPDNTLLAKRILSRLYRLKPRQQNRDIILLYHSIGEDSPWGVPVDNFHQQVKWLSTHTTIVSYGQLIDASTRQDAGIRVAVSFDDGYASIYSNAYGILENYDVKPIVYLNSNCVSEARRSPSSEKDGHYPGEEFLSWNDIRFLHSKGWQFGSHGMNHVDLTKCTESERIEELSGSRHKISTELRDACDHFSYTWGYYNKEVMKSVRDCGYKSAVGGIFGGVTRRSDRLSLPRYNIGREVQLADLKDIVYGYWDFMNVRQKVSHVNRIWSAS